MTHMHLPSFRRLIGMASWNLAGLLLPVAAAAAFIPSLLRNVGTERFGVLTLIWALIGYCGLFDFGLGRALTQHLIQHPESGHRGRVVPMVLSMLAILGTAGALLAAFIGTTLHPPIFGLSAAVADEVRPAVVLTAAALPFVTLTSGLRGVLEARMEFARLSMLRAALGFLTFAGPSLVSNYTPSLPIVISPILIARVLATGAHAWLVGSRVRPSWPVLSVVGPIFRMGGWLTLSNLLSPLMVSADRFVVAAILTASSVAYYSTPQELVARFLVFPAAILGVWYPALCHARSNSVALRPLMLKGVGLVGAVVIPCSLLLTFYSHQILDIWLGAEMADRSCGVLSILSIGLAANALAHIPLAVLYARNKAHLPAVFHLCELPVYFTAVYLLTYLYGLEGAALAWAGRVLVDAGLLFWAALHGADVEQPSFDSPGIRTGEGATA
jgi:O-antigen/teichoic acid export membrane protein